MTVTPAPQDLVLVAKIPLIHPLHSCACLHS
jgi:hypothetical protein